MKKKIKRRPKTRHAAPLIRVTPPPPKPWELNAQEVELVKQHICPGASDLELQFNLTVARRFKLDPFRQQIWFVPRKHNNQKKWIPIVGINGLLHIAARDHADFGSISDPEYGPMMKVEYNEWEEVRGRWTKVGTKTLMVPEWARASTTKKGMTEPTTATVYWEEIYPNIDSSPMVRQMRRHMLGKCAVAHAIRRAYPSTDGLYISEEFAGQRPDYTREGREIEYREPVRYDDVQKEAIENLRSRGDWCEEHNCSRSMKHLREYHFDQIGTKPEEFASSSTASKPTQSVPTGGQVPQTQSPVQHASGPAGDSHPKKPRTTPKQSPAEPITDKAADALINSAKKLIDKNLGTATATVAANSKPNPGGGNEGSRVSEGTASNVPTASQDSSLNFKPPQARIPFVVKSVRPTPKGAGRMVLLETGKWLYCFDNRKMGEDGETAFSILDAAPGKLCTFLTKISKKKGSDQEYVNITHILQCSDREWDEDGISVLRREPANIRVECPHCGRDITESSPEENRRHLQKLCLSATGKEREPGEDSMEEWLK